MLINPKDIQKKIENALPPGKVVAMHDGFGHWYGVLLEGIEKDPTEKYVDERFVVEVDGKRYAKYPSVTGKLQILKDESLINYKKNQIIQYVSQHFHEMNEANLMEHLTKADHVPEDILADASDIGTQIHDTREKIFAAWIKTGEKPEHFFDFIDPAVPDMRLKSAIRALKSFCQDHSYVPIATELYVYSHKLSIAGTLDDIGMMDWTIRRGKKDCVHEMIHGERFSHCLKCDLKTRRSFVLMDLKSSNQFKDHYFFQVALYWDMIRKLIGISPQESFILKLSKFDGTYVMEDLKKAYRLSQYARHMLKTNDAISFIRSLRKDNQKNVVSVDDL